MSRVTEMLGKTVIGPNDSLHVRFNKSGVPVDKTLMGSSFLSASGRYYSPPEQFENVQGDNVQDSIKSFITTPLEGLNAFYKEQVDYDVTIRVGSSREYTDLGSALSFCRRLVDDDRLSPKRLSQGYSPNVNIIIDYDANLAYIESYDYSFVRVTLDRTTQQQGEVISGGDGLVIGPGGVSPLISFGCFVRFTVTLNSTYKGGTLYYMNQDDLDITDPESVVGDLNFSGRGGNVIILDNISINSKFPSASISRGGEEVHIHHINKSSDSFINFPGCNLYGCTLNVNRASGTLYSYYMSTISIRNGGAVVDSQKKLLQPTELTNGGTQGLNVNLAGGSKFTVGNTSGYSLLENVVVNSNSEFVAEGVTHIKNIDTSEGGSVVINGQDNPEIPFDFNLTLDIDKCSSVVLSNLNTGDYDLNVTVGSGSTLICHDVFYTDLNSNIITNSFEPEGVFYEDYS